MLVVDQFEELFTLDDASAERARSLCARLAGYATETAPVVVTVRADHVAALAVDDDFARLAERGLHLVKPLTGDSLRQAIEGPADAGRVASRTRVWSICWCATVKANPARCRCCPTPWPRRGSGATAGCLPSRGIGPPARSAAPSPAPPTGCTRACPPSSARSCVRCCCASSPRHPTANRCARGSPPAALGGDADRDRVLGLLVRARLVTTEEDSVELAHEALARAWPRLRSWLDEDAAGQRILRHLATAADGWESLGRPTSELYRGARLEAALEWRAATIAGPHRTERRRSSTPRSPKRPRSGSSSPSGPARRPARTGDCGVRSPASPSCSWRRWPAGVLAYQQRQTARGEEREAALTALTSNAAALRTNRRDLAALLAVEAHRLAPSAATESALFGTFTASPGVVRSVPTDFVINQQGTDATFVGGTDTVAVIDEVGAVHLVDLVTGERRQFDAFVEQDEIDDAWNGLVSDKEGRYLAAMWRPGVAAPGREFSLLTVWDVDTGERRFDAVRIPYRIGSMALSDDGAMVVVGGGRWGRVQVRRRRDGRIAPRDRRTTPPRGRLLGSGNGCGQVHPGR